MKKHAFLFLAGAFASLSMEPVNLWPALFLSLSLLYICITRTQNVKIAGLYGFFFSLGYFGFSLYWIGNALLIEDNPYWWAWPFAISGLPFILSLFTFTFVTIHKKLTKNQYGMIPFISFATALFLTDFARGNLFTGFPWNLYAYTWIDFPHVTQITKLWNVYLLNALTIIWALTPAILVCSQTKKTQKYIICVFAITTFAGTIIYGHTELQKSSTGHQTDRSNKKIEITTVQPNIKQSEKWKPENRIKNFISLIELSQYSENTDNSANAHYIIWPETAISQDLLDTPWMIDRISNTLSEYQNPAYLMTGALRKQNNRYFNSLIVIDKSGDIIHTYDKSHLVPFGEYMPLENIINIAPIVGFTGFEKGKANQKFQMPEDITIKPLICYEIIFPRKIKNTDLIINVTNDAWYGNSAGPYQHMTQTQFRAIETKTPIIRVANTGISGIISKIGKTQNKSDYGLIKKNVTTLTLNNE